MIALVKKRAEPGLSLEQVPIPEIGINDVLIKVDRTGICGTDLHIYLWNEWARKTIHPPLVIGHEFVGTIERVGNNVKDFSPGDVVSGEDTWSAAAAATAWPAEGTSAPIATASASRGPAPLPSTWRCR